MDRESDLEIREVCDRREVLERVVAQLARVRVREDRHRRHRRHQQRRAIGRRALDELVGEAPTGARLVVDDHGLVERLADLLADDAGQRVGTRAGRKAEHQAQRARRLRLCVRVPQPRGREGAAHEQMQRTAATPDHRQGLAPACRRGRASVASDHSPRQVAYPCRAQRVRGNTARGL
jgi:hypothetical protein